MPVVQCTCPRANLVPTTALPVWFHGPPLVCRVLSALPLVLVIRAPACSARSLFSVPSNFCPSHPALPHSSRSLHSLTPLAHSTRSSPYSLFALLALHLTRSTPYSLFACPHPHPTTPHKGGPSAPPYAAGRWRPRRFARAARALAPAALVGCAGGVGRVRHCDPADMAGGKIIAFLETLQASPTLHSRRTFPHFGCSIGYNAARATQCNPTAHRRIRPNTCNHV